MEERRKHPRFPAAKMAYLVGLGSPAQILNISYGGLCVRYKGEDDPPDEFVVDILQVSRSIIIDQVRCRKIWDETMGKATLYSRVQERRLGIQFVEPSEETFESLLLFKGSGEIK